MKFRLASVLVFLLCGACGDSASGDDFMGEDIPTPCQTGPCPATGSGSSSASGDTTAAATTTGGPIDQCQGSQDCGTGSVCAADFSEERGGFACRTLCILPMDETSYCSDDASCCEGSCNGRGYCVVSLGGSP